MKNILISLYVVLAIMGCNSSESNSINQSKTTDQDKINKIDKITSSTEKIIFEDRNSTIQKEILHTKYDYIPSGKNLTTRMAYRFLNMATFGATPELAKELKEKGVVNWVNEQLSMEYNYQSESITLESLKWMQKINPTYLNKYNRSTETKYINELKAQYPEESMDKIIKRLNEPPYSAKPYSIKDILDKNDLKLNKASYDDRSYLHSAIMNNMIYDKAQLRQRVAYALSQIIIASESVDKYFLLRATTLAYYYDILLEGAFKRYSVLLYNVSLSPAMSIFMTYNGSRKTYTKDGQIITPDENYGREIMQKFTIGLNKLSIDGMEYNDGLDFKQNYTQDDVNTMSRVFTGLSTRLSKMVHHSDVFNPIECNQDYHDTDEKIIFGKTIPANQNCKEDIKSAIDILINHNSSAPFISKKLIMRLTKSNPKNAYIARVARVFKDNGNGVSGDLKSVIKAILLDQDIWDDIKEGHLTKIREPYITYINALRLFDVQPLPKFQTYSATFQNSSYIVEHNSSIFTYQVEGYYKTHYKTFSQSPLMAPTVFNFYNDEFTPNNNEFRLYNHVAPEIEIQTSRVLANFSNKISRIFDEQDRTYSFDLSNEESYLSKSRVFADKISIDKSFVYNDIITLLEDINKLPIYTNTDAQKTYQKVVSTVVDSLSKRILGQKLKDKEKEIFIKYFSNPNYVKASKDNKKEMIYKHIINPILRYILLSSEYRVN